MTATEFIARQRRRFANSPLSAHEALLILRLFLHDFADHLCLARLADGQRLNDVTDSAAYARELAAVIEIEETMRQPPRAAICHTCGHPHPSGEECGVDMGGAGICGCKAEVPA